MKLLVIFAVIATAFAAGEVLQCYKHEPTANSFDEKKATIANCTSSSCQKNVTEFSNGTMYSRGCGLDLTITSVSVSRAEKINLNGFHAYFCTENLCNGANSMVSASLKAVLIIVTAILYG